MSVEITSLAARGDGVTEDGRYVPPAAPGDRLTDDGAVLAGPFRAVPPCRHFPTCGGCQLQHIDEPTRAAFTAQRIEEALAAQGIAAPEIRTPHLSPPRSRRRASLRAERRGGQVIIGFNEQASYRIVDLAECHILRPELFALVAPLRPLLADMIPERRAADVQMTLTDQGVDLILSGVAAEGLQAHEALTAFAQAHHLARISIDDGLGPETRWEPEGVTVTLGNVPVPFPPGAFLQATTDGEAALVAAVREGVGEVRTVLDLFAGLGTFALSLPAKVLAAEGARDAILALKAAAGRSGKPVLTDHRDLFRRPYPAKDIGRFDAVVLDPPRAGAKEQSPEIAASGVARVVYVSCNPATFARDAKALLASGYRLDWILPVGQFRWSTHVELVGLFLKQA
ncbi:class I SAM-dependent RNA methyltransferase [Sphingomonas sp. ID0503]|uniref:class I SAM-dependent RNA methyltransferase n=1 Tax=Sphingomonas sp. ID0503 TaxID=3399691 RepID=UPI003AFA3CC4